MTRHSKDDAYRLTDVESHRAYYDEWANSYDAGFADEEGYIYPESVARRYIDLAGPDDSPVADLGCGTGLAGVAFAGSGFSVDGFDVSEGMLAQARAKRVYRNLRIADLTRQTGLPRGQYGGLISCGTFTLGHLGPADLEASLVMARGGALCVIGINAQHFSERGFGDVLRSLEATGDIVGFRIEDADIYSSGDGADNVNVARLAIFRTAAKSDSA
ncbi:MAG: class I SAM-dependent methyltransferase [Rhodospirillaceae bacterium]|nr:class I SAM-dependent methyltransferase [Rhodospirillaceae bacterium]